MKLKYEAQKNSRIKNQFTGFESEFCNLWFCEETKTWDLKGNSSHRYCRSIRAFRRMLKYAPKGVCFVLWNRFEGYKVWGVGCGG